MKKATTPTKHSLLVTSILVLLGAAVSPLIHAETKTMQTTADHTLAASERQAVLGLSRLGLEQTRFRFPVSYCGHKQRCLPVGVWSVRIDQDYADKTLAKNMTTLIPSRYDRLIFEGNEVSLTTATQRYDSVELPSAIPAISSQTASYEAYKERLLAHLNTNIAPLMVDLLGDAAEARYSEMNAQEKNTFITDKARAVGMPVEVLESLVSSGYAFGLYLPEISGAIIISQVEKTLPDGRKIWVYRSSLNAPLKTKLMVFEFDGENFNSAHEIAAESSSPFDLMAQSMSAGSSIETIFLPSQKDAQHIFDEAFQNSFKDSTIAISTKLKALRAFAIATPVVGSELENHVELRVGNQENIRVDHPFTFNRTIDGEEQQVGWGQVRQTGDNCLVLPESKRTYSQAKLVQGEVNELDMAIEHPWTGVYGRMGYSSSDTSLSLDGKDTGAGAANFIEIGFIGNLGYILNKPNMSEVWANIDLGFGSNAGGKLNDQGFSGSGASRLRFGAEKRYHLKDGVYIAAGGDLAFEGHSYSNDISITTINLIPRAEAGYFFNPNVKVYGGASYNMPMSSSVEGTSLSASMSGGLSFNLGFAMHVNFAGPFARMTAQPSARCNSLREELNSDK